MMAEVIYCSFSRQWRAYVLQLGKAPSCVYIYGRLGSQSSKARATRVTVTVTDRLTVGKQSRPASRLPPRLLHSAGGCCKFKF
jgi:hypothetical protein